MTRGEAVNWIINISADIGKAEHRELWHYEQALLEIREMLESEPERATGKWMHDKDDELFSGYCSCCGWESVICETDVADMPYCPNCGAYMRGEQE